MNSFAPLASDEIDLQRRFGGLARLYGEAGARAIASAHVVVVGIGGVGSWAAEALARSGVGRLTLIDLDQVSESNVNRQVHALTRTIGQAKVSAMRERIAEIHAGCEVRCIEEFVTPDNWPALADLTEVTGQPLAVIDACDRLSAKVSMAAWAMAKRVPFICVGAAGGKRHAHRVDVADLSEVTHDPLLAQLRYRLRKHHAARRQGRMQLLCVFSREAVVQSAADCDPGERRDSSLNCHGYGSVVSVTATFGQCAAGWVLDQLASGA